VKEQSTPDSLDLEVGRRLGQLRIRAGLTQAQLAARLTGVNKGWQQAVSRAELGKAGHISFPFVVDCMRACGASFADIEDILDRYLSRPPRIEERAWQAVQAAAANLPDRMKTRALYYDIGLHSKAGQQARKASDVDERVRRAVNRGKTEAMEQRLHQTFNDVLNELHIAWGDPLATHLRSYGRKVFAALRRTRKSRPIWREKAMVKLDAWPAQYGLDPGPFVLMKTHVTALFDKLLRAGELA
jgi:transcriptional regulator with XRE-family HTH domain